MLGAAHKNGRLISPDGLVIIEGIGVVPLADGHLFVHGSVEGSLAIVFLHYIIGEVESDTEHGYVVVVFDVVVGDVVVAHVKAVVGLALDVHVRAVGVVHDHVIRDVTVQVGRQAVGFHRDAAAVLG